MNTKMWSALAAAAVGGALSAASGAVVNTTITADNHYAIYRTNGVGIELVGGNELGGGGSPGTYNWSSPETFSFNTDGAIYIAAWSDDSVAQGLLAQLTIDGVEYNSGNTAWQVMATNSDLDDGAGYPTSIDIAIFTAIADTFGLWEVPAVGATNGSAPSPWGAVAGIDADPKWTWRANPLGGDPFRPGQNLGEFLIFRIPVPTPGTGMLALAAIAVLAPARRR